MIPLELIKLAHTADEGNDFAQYNGGSFQAYSLVALSQGTREKIALFNDFFRSVPIGTRIRILKRRFEYCAAAMLQQIDRNAEHSDIPLTYKEIDSLGLLPVKPAVGLLREGTIARVVGVLDSFEVFSPYLSIDEGPAFAIGSVVEEDPEQGFEAPYELEFEVVID